MRPSSKPEDPNDTRACRKKALDLLARREHARAELGAKLKVRGFTLDCIECVLDRLIAEGLMDDARFAEVFVRARASRRQGPIKILAELRSRGLADGVIDEAVRDSEQDWTDLARQARAKRFGFDPPPGFADRARQRRFLESRGFSAEQINSALDLAADTD